MRVALLAVASVCLACGIPYGGDLGSPRWDMDGRHIFYLEQRFITAPHPYEYFRLYRALADGSERDKIDSGSIEAPTFGSGSVSPSPDGRYLVYVTRSSSGQHLHVYDLAKGREALRSDFARSEADSLSIIWPAHIGWRPDSGAIYYTDGAGVELLPVEGGAARRLVPGESRSAAGSGWSPDGRFFYHATGNGWPRGNQLYALELATGQDRLVASTASGLIGPVVFAPGGARLAFSVFLIGGDHSSVQVAEPGGAPTEWARIPAKWAERIAWTEQADTLLVGLTRDDSGAVLACVGPDRIVRVVTMDRNPVEFGWDYHQATSRLVQVSPNRAEFTVRDFTGCDTSLSRL